MVFYHFVHDCFTIILILPLHGENHLELERFHFYFIFPLVQESTFTSEL